MKLKEIREQLSKLMEKRQPRAEAQKLNKVLDNIATAVEQSVDDCREALRMAGKLERLYEPYKGVALDLKEIVNMLGKIAARLDKVAYEAMSASEFIEQS